MPLKYVPYLILALAAGIVGFGVWYQRQHPPRVIATGTLSIESPAGSVLRFETRVVEIGMFRRTELRLPNGTWIDCAGDCREAVLRDHLAVFEKMREHGN